MVSGLCSKLRPKKPLQQQVADLNKRSKTEGIWPLHHYHLWDLSSNHIWCCCSKKNKNKNKKCKAPQKWDLGVSQNNPGSCSKICHFQVCFKCVNFFYLSYFLIISILSYMQYIWIEVLYIIIYVLNHYYNDNYYECKDNKQYKNTLD